MKKLICLFLCLCLLGSFGLALAASGEPGGEASDEPGGEPSGEASGEASSEPGGEEEETALDLNFNGIRVADLGVDVTTDGQGNYRFSLKTLLSLLGLEMSIDETDGSLVVQDSLGILGALLK